MMEGMRSVCGTDRLESNALVEIWRDEPVPSSGPFVGVPFAVKDIGLTAKGRKVEFGSRLAEGLCFEDDSDLMNGYRLDRWDDRLE